jgi:uncharacterized repeat protein (TIGR01451 family)
MSIVTLARADVSPLQVTLIPELRVAELVGKEIRYRFVPAQQVTQGQEIYYTARITNLANEKVKHPIVDQPVPANTHLVERSVTGGGAAVSYSIDGGKNFMPSSELRSAAADSRTPLKITHIRWQFRHALAPHVTVLARFRVVFD